MVTQGAGGSYGYLRGREYFQPALEVRRVTDTTGCGDAYQAAFALTWLVTGDMQDSMRAGALAASEVAQIWGGVAGLYEPMPGLRVGATPLFPRISLTNFGECQQ